MCWQSLVGGMVKWTGTSKIESLVVSYSLSLSLTFTYTQTFSLLASIVKERPELSARVGLRAPPTAQPIPEEMPKQFRKLHTIHIEGIGQPITSCSISSTSANMNNWYFYL